MMNDYQTILKKVEEAFENGVTYNLGIAFAKENDGQLVTQIVAEQFTEATKGVEVFEMTIEEYLFEQLEMELEVSPETAGMQNEDKFENEETAEENGYFWEDELNKWLKLHHY